MIAEREPKCQFAGSVYRHFVAGGTSDLSVGASLCGRAVGDITAGG
jgi:hypothetical protein